MYFRRGPRRCECQSFCTLVEMLSRARPKKREHSRSFTLAKVEDNHTRITGADTEATVSELQSVSRASTGGDPRLRGLLRPASTDPTVAAGTCGIRKKPGRLGPHPEVTRGKAERMPMASFAMADLPLPAAPVIRTTWVDCSCSMTCCTRFTKHVSPLSQPRI
jgi:hypothetical protein